MTDQTSLALQRTSGMISLPRMSRDATPRDKVRVFTQQIMRHRFLIVLTLVLLNGLAIPVVVHMQRRYTAEAQVIISPRQQQVTDLKAVLAGLSGDSDVIESEIQVLRSRDVARLVVEQLHLDRDAEFNPSLVAPGLLSKLTPELTRIWTLLVADLPATLRDFFAKTSFDVVHEPPASDPLSASVDAFLNRLGVAAKGRSRVMGISVESANPQLAANAANAVADAYIANQLKAKQEATTNAHVWLDERVSELRQQVRDADEAVEAYRRRTGITQGKSGTLLNEQITTLGEQVIGAQNTEAEVGSRLQAAETGGHHAFGLNQEYQAARQRSQTLATNLGALRQQAEISNENEIELRALQHDADANRTLYDRLLARSKETQVESGLQQPDAQIISRAEAPKIPTFPKPTIMLPMVFVASLVIAVLMVMAVESLDQGYSTLEQVETSLGIAAIGVVPLLKRSLLRARNFETHVLSNPDSAFSETIRNLYTSLILSDATRPIRTVLIASALPGEGKSLVALALARLMASCGKRVVLVDCDLRRPQLHRSFKVSQGPGLTDCLDGKVSLLDVIVRDTVSSALLVPAGTGARTAPDLLGSEGMLKALHALSGSCDLILLDSPPLLAVSDTRNLCRLADKTVFVVRWQDTRHFAAAAALRLITEAGGDLVGCLLSMVDLRRYARYADAGFYRRRISLYLGGR